MEFSGRASHLHLTLSAVGICGLGFLLILIILGNASLDPFQMGMLIVSMPALGLGMVLFSYFLYRGARRKTIFADDSGIRFSVGERTEWEVPWKRALLLLSFRIPPEMDEPPTYGFELFADGKAYSVSEDRDIGPESRLREAFRSLAMEALQQGIPVNDKCGWAADMVLEDEYRKGQAFPRPELEGRWHTVEGLSKGTAAIPRRARSAILLGGTAFTFGIAWTMLSTLAPLAASVVVPPAAVLFVIAVYLGERTTLYGLRINGESLSLRFYAGKDAAIPWPDIREIRVVRIMGRPLMSIALPDGRERAGAFGEEVCEAARGRYATCRFGGT